MCFHAAKHLKRISLFWHTHSCSQSESSNMTEIQTHEVVCCVVLCCVASVTDQFCLATIVFLSLLKAALPNDTPTWGECLSSIYFYSNQWETGLSITVLKVCSQLCGSCNPFQWEMFENRRKAEKLQRATISVNVLWMQLIKDYILQLDFCCNNKWNWGSCQVTSVRSKCNPQ